MSAKLDILYVIVDGSNIALSRRTNKKKGKIENLELIISLLRNLEQSRPIKWEIIIDATLRYRIDNKEKLERILLFFFILKL